MGLKEAYSDGEDPTIRNDIRILMAIPFVPVDHVQEIFDAIADSVAESVLYIERTYIRGIEKCTARESYATIIKQ